jgi:hypothetical protein
MLAATYQGFGSAASVDAVFQRQVRAAQRLHQLLADYRKRTGGSLQRTFAGKLWPRPVARRDRRITL